MIIEMNLSDLPAKYQDSGQLIKYKKLTELVSYCRVGYDSVWRIFNNSLRRFSAVKVGHDLYVTDRIARKFCQAQSDGDILANAQHVEPRSAECGTIKAFENEVMVRDEEHSHASGMGYFVNNALGGDV